MADFLTNIKVSFIDDFSKGAKAAEEHLKGLNVVAGGMDRAGRSMLKAGAGLTAGLTAPLVGVGIAAVKAGQDLDRAMANVQSLGLAQERVVELKRGVQDVAVATGTATGLISEGLYDVVSAFGDSADTLGILEENAKIAKAGLSTVSEAISLTSAITKGYGDTSLEAVKRAGDLSLTIVKLGQTNFPELAASLGRVVPLAAALGVQEKELAAGFATLTGVTGTSAEVSTQLRGTLQALMVPTADMAALIEQQGFSSGKAMLQGIGLERSFLAIAQAAKASGKPLQSYMGSIEGQTALLTLTGPQLDAFAAKMKNMEDVAGATDEAFLAQTDGIGANGAAMDIMRVKMEVVLQRLSDGLVPAISSAITVVAPFVDKISALATKFAELEPAQQKTIVKILGVVAAAGPALMMFGGMARGVGGIISVVKVVIPVLAGLAAANWAVVAPVLAVVGGLALLAAGVVLVVKHWESIKGFFAGVWEGIKNAFRAGVDWVVGMLDTQLVQGALAVVVPFFGIPLLIVKNWESIKGFFANLWQGIKEIFEAGISWVKDMVAKIPIVGGLFNQEEEGGFLGRKKRERGLFGGKRERRGLFGRLNPAAATVDTFGAGITQALPAAERTGLQIATAVDDYLPHSNAKKGPLSRLTESGASLVDTLRQGAAKRRLDLSGPLKLVSNVSAGTAGESVVININGDIQLQSDDITDVVSFVRMLKVAGGVA